jgi:hypothetical protein
MVIQLSLHCNYLLKKPPIVELSTVHLQQFCEYPKLLDHGGSPRES